MPDTSSEFGWAHKGRVLCGHWDKASGIEYQFDVVCGTSVVVFVKTEDPRFRSPEGFAIGDSLADAVATPGASLRPIEDSCGVVLPSGWIARPASRIAVERDEECTELLAGGIAYFETRYVGP